MSIGKLGLEILGKCPSPKTGKTILQSNLLAPIAMQKRSEYTSKIDELVADGLLISLKGEKLQRTNKGDKEVAKPKKTVRLSPDT